MIKRFSLYGFLKNLRFFEPFFLLFLREKGLSFFEIGFLFSFREICINIMEIPSGALADLYGRKTVMLLSLTSYIASFIIFGTAANIWVLFAAMFFFAIGDAFRTGTHKAMIFDWLKHEGRQEDKTMVYGYTRSWSQMGSALSVLLAAGLVFYSGSYDYVFWFSIFPYLLGLWNLALYPSWLNKKIESKVSIKGVFKHLWITLKHSFRKKQVRHLILQSMIFTGKFKAIKDYLQIIIKAQILIFPAVFAMDEEKQTAVLIGIVYFILYLLTSAASKNAFKIVKLLNGKCRSRFVIIIITIGIFGFSAFGTYFELYFIPIIGFILFYILQNFYRPILISSFDDCTESDKQATVLSIESQAVSVGVFVLAPIVGYAADHYGLHAVFALSSIVLCVYVCLTVIFHGKMIMTGDGPDCNCE